MIFFVEKHPVISFAGINFQSVDMSGQLNISFTSWACCHEVLTFVIVNQLRPSRKYQLWSSYIRLCHSRNYILRLQICLFENLNDELMTHFFLYIFSQFNLNHTRCLFLKLIKILWAETFEVEFSVNHFLYDFFLEKKI